MASILERNKKIKAPKKTMSDHAEDALYREVWEEVNNDKTQRFLKKYARALIASALVLLIIVTGFQIWHQSYQASKIAAAQNYETAIGSMDTKALAAISKNTGGATSDLALFQSFMMDGNISKLESLAKDGKTRDFRDLATLHLAGLKGDALSAKDLEKFLSPLNTTKSPFYYSSRLMLARKHLAVGNKAAAVVLLDKIINDKNAPSIIAANAQSLK